MTPRSSKLARVEVGGMQVSKSFHLKLCYNHLVFCCSNFALLDFPSSAQRGEGNYWAVQNHATMGWMPSTSHGLWFLGRVLSWTHYTVIYFSEICLFSSEFAVLLQALLPLCMPLELVCSTLPLVYQCHRLYPQIVRAKQWVVYGIHTLFPLHFYYK